MKNTLFIILASLVILGLCIVAYFRVRWRVRRQRQAEQIRTVRSCPFCQQGTLSIDPAGRQVQRRGRAFYTWKCNRCNDWEVADLLGNPLPEQGR